MDGRRARNVLGVGKDAGPDEIRRAFRARALVTHPDHGGDDAAFAELMDAFAAVRAVEPRRPLFRALPKTGPRVDVYDSAPRSQPRRDFADVLRAAAARLG
jgi:curved DNA-binding protein CbpA